MGKIILASSSPRRNAILKNLGMKFEVIPSKCDESAPNIPPEEMVCYIAKKKAMDVKNRCSREDVIIAADTVVSIDNKIIGKPKNMQEAFDTLRNLSGREHKVITGICIMCEDSNVCYQSFEVTKVFFKSLSDEEIWDYINTSEPLDKAGSYGIQGFGGLFVEKIDGCYYNVVGLPIKIIYKVFREMGINLLKEEV